MRRRCNQFACKNSLFWILNRTKCVTSYFIHLNFYINFGSLPKEHSVSSCRWHASKFGSLRWFQCRYFQTASNVYTKPRYSGLEKSFVWKGLWCPSALFTKSNGNYDKPKTRYDKYSQYWILLEGLWRKFHNHSTIFQRKRVLYNWCWKSISWRAI